MGAGCLIDINQNVGLFGIACIPPVVRDAGSYSRRFTWAETTYLSGNPCIQPAPDYREALLHMGMGVLAHDGGPGPGGQVDDRGPVAAIFRTSQNNRVLPGYGVFVDIAET